MFPQTWSHCSCISTASRTGQSDNTLIIFGSDHGEYLGDYNCFGLRTFFDASARIPLIVRWPNRSRAGGVCDRPASLVDIAPTILAASGADASGLNLDGVDLAGLADGSATRELVYFNNVYALMWDAAVGGNRVDRRAESVDPAIYANYAAISERYKYACSDGGYAPGADIGT
jgi:hypothetical protein